MSGQPWAMVVFAGPSLAAATMMPPGVLAECLGVTRTEGRLACALAGGASVNDSAAAQGCGLSIARSLLHQTGRRRQRDLVLVAQDLRGA
ncbi:hypothetical protein ACXIUT_08665 [Achromobacter denitrificans]